MAQQDASTLGEGQFGKVYKKLYKGQWACIKRVPEDRISERDLRREYKVYCNVHHTNVVRLLGVPWSQDLKWNIPLEFISGEELETTIFRPDKSKILLTPTVSGTIIKGMCAGLSHLHSKDIVHQDIKPDNIMVEHGTNRAVIIDLGLAKFFKGGITSAQNLGNFAYSAPEILLQNGVRDKRSDVWAMGKVIAELLIRPRDRLPTLNVTFRKIWPILPEPYRGTVSKMVYSNPAARTRMPIVEAEIIQALAGVMKLPMKLPRREVKAERPQQVQRMPLAAEYPQRGLGQSQRVLGQSLWGLGQSRLDLGQSLWGLGQSRLDLGQSIWGLGQSRLDLGHQPLWSLEHLLLTQSQMDLGDPKLALEQFLWGQRQPQQVRGQSLWDLRQPQWF
ncbi:serine/threonine-protein kinase Nek6-like [Sardina pilchardus]|uniref:serine/threonine-protein kinase Nek6-like n=1 Tax=Sardina pilchardus TaxID=27697 RepID=UPI002E164986